MYPDRSTLWFLFGCFIKISATKHIITHLNINIILQYTKTIETTLDITFQNPLRRTIPAQTYEKRGICCARAVEMKAVKNHNQQITIHNRFGRLRSWSFVAAAINIIRNIARAAMSTETG